MRPFRLAVLASALLVVPWLHADATARFKMTFKTGAGLPPQAAQAMANVPQLADQTMTISVKGDRESVNNTGMGLVYLIDISKQQVSLLSAASKMYATIDISSLSAQIAAAVGNGLDASSIPPEAQQFLNSIKVNVSTQDTGNTDTIAGIQAAETVVTLGVDMAMPAGAPGAGMNMTVAKIVFHLWMSRPGEGQRVAGLAELLKFNAASQQVMNPVSMLKPLTVLLPQLSEAMDTLTSAMVKKESLGLRCAVEIYSPALTMFAQMGGADAATTMAGTDPNAPLMSVQEDLSDISEGAVDDSQFQIPPDYKVAPFPDIIKAAKPAGAI